MQPNVRRKSAGSRGAGRTIILSTAAFAGALLAGLPSALSAAQAQAPADTIPIMPLEVTVLRTPFLNDNAPFAVAVRTEADLRRGRSGVFIEEALQGMPGVQVQNRFNPAVGERIMVRGFGARAQFGLRGFRVVVDGIPATLPDGQASLDHLDVASLGRVEVLRGPSSALFGNAGGGVLSFSTRAPSTLPYEIEAEAVGGSDGLLRGQLTASGTQGTTGYLVSVYSLQSDGFRKVPDESPRFDTLQAYGAFERMGLNARVSRPVAGGELAITANVTDLGAENPGSTRSLCPEGVTTNCFTAGAPPSAAELREVENTYLLFRTRKDVTQQQGGVRWNGPLGGFSGDFSVYLVHRTVFNPLPVDVVDLNRNGMGLRASLGRSYQLALGGLEWHAGVDLDTQDDDRQEFANAGGVPTGAAQLDQQENVRGLGLFLQTNLELESGAVILGGVRYDSNEFEVTDRVPVTGGNPDSSGSRTMSRFSPSIGVDVPVGGALNLFASASSLFETPTTTELANQETQSGGFNPDLDPMTGRSFEAGIRGDIGSMAAIEVTAYQTRLNDELVPFEVAAAPGITYYQNAGSSKHTGIEAALSVSALSGLLRGDLSYTYTDAVFEDYQPTSGPDAGLDLSGNRVPGIAPRRIQALIRVTPEVGGFAELIVTSMDGVPVNNQNTTETGAYQLLDLRFGHDGFAFGNVTLTPWAAITNLLDEGYISSVAVNANGSRFFEPGPARSFQFGLRTRFSGN